MTANLRYFDLFLNFPLLFKHGFHEIDKILPFRSDLVRTDCRSEVQPGPQQKKNCFRAALVCRFISCGKVALDLKAMVDGTA